MGVSPGVGATAEGVGSDHEGVLDIDERSRYQLCAIGALCKFVEDILAAFPSLLPVKVVGLDGHESPMLNRC